MARILIVEDDLLIVEDLKHKLGYLGHTVIAHATTGEVAVQKANETRPELVLMDVRLRGEMMVIRAIVRNGVTFIVNDRVDGCYYSAVLTLRRASLASVCTARRK